MTQHRRAARVILVNDRDEVLLLRGTDPQHPEAGTWWLTPGGGLNDGESLTDAAARELFEETGAHVTDLGETVFTRTGDFTFNGVHYIQDEWYFVGRIAHFEPTFAGFEEHEVSAINGWRWWPRESLRATAETIYPNELIELLDIHVPRA
jgi:8-oxo-dGTP pyrophosphatase MutT (NUDIX family)